MSLDVDLLRPLLSMPPVVLMMGDGSGSPRLNMYSVPPSPIVEMPPSPAPSQLGVVEYPPEDDVYEYDEDEYVVEVRTLIFKHISNHPCELTIPILKKAPPSRD
jgi:hypothetical protein